MMSWPNLSYSETIPKPSINFQSYSEGPQRHFSLLFVVPSYSSFFQQTFEKSSSITAFCAAIYNPKASPIGFLKK